VLRHRRRILDQRRRPVHLVGGHRRELDVHFLRDRARLRDVCGDARDAADLVLGDDPAAGESPHAAVNHAGAAAPPAGAPAPPPPPPPAPATAAAESAAAVLAIGATVGVDAAAHAARETDVGIGAADLLRLAERDVRQALEFGGHRIAFWRLRDQLSYEIARHNEQTRCTRVRKKLATTRTHTNLVN